MRNARDRARIRPLGQAGTWNGTAAPFTIPPTSSSGTGTTSRRCDTCWITRSGTSFPGPTSAPGWTSRSVTTPSNGAVIFRYACRSLQRPNRRLRRPARLLPRIHQRLAASTCFSAWISSLPAIAPGVSAAFFSALVRALRRRQLRFGLQAVRFRRLHFGLRFGDLRGHFRRAQFDQQIALLDNAAAVHQHALHVARNLGMQRDAQERQKLARQFDRSRHRLGHHRRQVAGLRPASLRQAVREYRSEQEGSNALHSIGSRDPSD